MNLVISLILSFIFLISNSVSSQNDIVVFGKVLDKDANGIPYASIGLRKENFGAVTFEDGSFSLSIKPEYLTQSLTISAIGFETRNIEVLKILESSTIVLAGKVNVLQEVIITPSDYELMDFGADKNQSPNSFNIASPSSGATIAVLYNEIGESFWIKKTQVSTGRKNMREYLLRCRIFLVDKQTNYPGKELLNYNLIKRGNKENEIVIFNLLEELFIAEPFYIGFEWIVSREQNVLLKKVESQFSINAFISKELVDKELNPVLYKDKKIKYFNSSGQLIEEETIGRDERKKLKARKRLSPKVIFQTQKKGNKTIYGSYVTQQWTDYHRSALTSISVLKKKD